MPFPGCDTIYEVFQYALKRNGNRPALGTREHIKARTQPEGRLYDIISEDTR